jgi:hypothetical protein
MPGTASARWRYDDFFGNVDVIVSAASIIVCSSVRPRV